MKKCPYCGAELNDECLFCTECGKELPKGTVCPHCGASVNDGDVFCANCGKKIIEKSVEQLEEQESPQIPNVSESNTSKKILPIIVGVIVFAILGAGWWSYKSSKEKANVNLDSLFTANLDEVKDNVEDVKFAEFREAFTIGNIQNLLGNPKNKSLAQKCGLDFLYEEEETGGEINCFEVVYGYDVEKGNKKEDSGYDINASSQHAVFLKYRESSGIGWTVCFKSKDDVNYFINEAKKHGFSKTEYYYTNGNWAMTFNEILENNGWFYFFISEPEESGEDTDSSNEDSFKQYSDYVGTWKLNRTESGQKMRIEVTLKENHSGEFVVFHLTGSRDEVLIYEEYPQCKFIDGVIYLTKNGDITRGDVPKLKATSDGLYSFDNEKYERESR